MDRHVIPCHLLNPNGRRVKSFDHVCRGPGLTAQDLNEARQAMADEAARLGMGRHLDVHFGNGEYRTWGRRPVECAQ